MWNSRRILKELADDDRRRQIVITFWKNAEPHPRALAAAQLAKAMNFREQAFKKLPVEKRADLLASRAGTGEFDQFVEMALMQYHTKDKAEMLGAFLDQWQIPHENGSIEEDQYKTPTVDEVRNAAAALSDRFDRRDIAIYFATAGLLMGDEWREATWPVADELAAQLA